jgi:tetratricopeptide (TPR) repeat protein
MTDCSQVTRSKISFVYACGKILQASNQSMDSVMQLIKEVEVSDDEDVRLPPTPRTGSHRDQGEEDEEPEPSCTVVWDSSEIKNRHALSLEDLSGVEGIQNNAAFGLKEQGNAYFKAGDMHKAAQTYLNALKKIELDSSASPVKAQKVSREDEALAAVIQSNLAAAYLGLKKYSLAVATAQKACALRPSWPKPLYRLAEAQLCCGKLSAAAATCSKGHSLLLNHASSEGYTDFTPMLDRIAIAAAIQGNYRIGFPGRQLEVRSAGDEAWLGRPAPYDPDLDGTLTEDELTSQEGASLALAGSLSKSTSTSNVSATQKPVQDDLVTWTHSNSNSALTSKIRTSFRSIKEAIAAAKDGDRILLLKGTHNGMGETLTINKRILIQGQGSLGETVIDQRANNPTFRLLRAGTVLHNIDIDHTGFREALLIEGRGASFPGPLVDGCHLQCSGDDVVHMAGQANAMLRGCIITGKKAGLRAFEESKVIIDRCAIEKCGTQGISVMETAQVIVSSTTISDCSEEGMLAMDRGQLHIGPGCLMENNKGPGVDASGHATVRIVGAKLSANVGGVWVWDGACCTLSSVQADGGPSHVVLVDGMDSRVEAASCRFCGSIHAPDRIWDGLLNKENRNQFIDPPSPTDFPPEQGPFCFVPDQFTRKQ